MDRSTPVYLISETFAEDEFGVLQPEPRKRKVYANVTSVSAAEWFEGGRSGLNPEWRVIMFAPDYKGEETIMIGGVSYAIYRRFQARTDTLELYCQRKKGEPQMSEGVDA